MQFQFLEKKSQFTLLLAFKLKWDVQSLCCVSNCVLARRLGSQCNRRQRPVCHTFSARCVRILPKVEDIVWTHPFFLSFFCFFAIFLCTLIVVWQRSLYGAIYLNSSCSSKYINSLVLNQNNFFVASKQPESGNI